MSESVRPAVIAVCLIAMLGVLVAGLAASGVLTDGQWSPVLASQAGWVLAFAALATLACVWALPLRFRGWPALSAVAVMACAVLSGIGPSLAALMIALCCITAGHALFLLAAPACRPDPLLAGATGLGGLMLVLVGAGLSHVAMLPVFWLIVAATLAALATWPGLRASLLDSLTPRAGAEPWTLPRAVLAWLILAALLFYGANAALPERFWDALVMHMMIPSQILLDGHWVYEPGRFAWALFPLAADYTFAFAMALGGEDAVKLINMLALGGILLTLFDIVRGMATVRQAEMAMLLVLSLPIALLSSTAAMVENLLCLQILAATRAVLLLRAGSRLAPLLALAVILPSIMALKLHGAAAVAPIAVIALVRGRFRGLLRRDWVVVLGVLAAAGALGLSQYAYAFHRTGNPVFPVMNNLFRSPLWPPVAFEDLRWQGHLAWDLLYRMTFDSGAYVEGYKGAMGFALLVMLIPGVVATLLAPREAPVVCLVVAGVYCAVVLRQIQYIRYLYPVMPLLLVVCAHGLHQLGAVRWGRVLGGGAAGLAAMLGLLVLPAGAWTLRAANLRAGFDPVERHTMLANQVSTRLAVDAVNALGEARPRVLFGGEPYGAFLRGTWVYAAWYNRELNAALITAPEDQVDAILGAERPGWVIATPASTDFVEKRVVAYALRHGARVALPGSAGLWRIDH
jgi:hypothetical protein